jgi:ADP-heptose:LPS heptosyltransferase
LNTDMLENMACLAESLGAPRGEWRLEGAITSPGNGRMRAEPVAGRIPGGKPLVGIHPGGRYSTQRWPLRRFQETAWELLRGGCQVLFFQEPGAGAPLPAGLVVPEAGTVADLIARLPAVDLLLCNNSGPLHIARALGVPTVSLAGPTRNAFLPHEGEKHTVLGAALPCRPCDKAVCWHHTCLESIEVARVVSAVRAKLENLPACSALLPALPPEGGGKKERGTR